jgi:hypothetical protein
VVATAAVMLAWLIAGLMIGFPGWWENILTTAWPRIRYDMVWTG